MALASLIDAGADLDEVISGLQCLPVSGWRLEAAKTTKAGLAATEVRVDVSGEDAATERTWATVQRVIEGAAALPARAKERALGVFARLAAAEGRLHGAPPEEVHFHEVGSTDALIDVVGTCLALESLGVSSVRSSPVALGGGTARSAHGAWPVPAPAVLELLAGAPVHGTAHEVELTTPTGAALLAALAESFGPLPAVRVLSSGYGAGAAELAGAPNVVQVVVGELLAGPHGEEGRYEDLIVLETNVDDATGETLAHAIAALLAGGALDAWVAPVLAKKGRPGHLVSALCEPSAAPGLARVMLSETGSFGARQHHVERWALPRRLLEVEVEGVRVRVKAGPYRLKAEDDDCARAAARLGLPVREIARRAEVAAAGHLGVTGQ